MTPTTNILARTFRIKTAKGTGTAFTVDVDGKRYLVSAQRVVGIAPSESIAIETSTGWEDIKVETVGQPVHDIDIAVLSPNVPLHDHSYPIDIEREGRVSFGQDVFMCGFPLGISSPTHYPDFPYPRPWTKKSILSNSDQFNWFLDGTVNPGMSGGPVFVMDSAVPTILGVVAAHRLERAVVCQADNSEPPEVYTNAGIGQATRFDSVLSRIESDPRGLPL